MKRFDTYLYNNHKVTIKGFTKADIYVQYENGDQERISRKLFNGTFQKKYVKHKRNRKKGGGRRKKVLCTKNGNTQEFDSVTTAARITNVKENTIYQSIKQSSRANGYLFRYKEECV